MTNEDIIKQYTDNWEYPETYHKDDILKMLDQARKDEAVEFGMWITSNAFEPCGINLWHQSYSDATDEREYTTEELYQLFKKSKQ